VNRLAQSCSGSEPSRGRRWKIWPALGIITTVACLAPPRGEPLESSRGPVLDRSVIINSPGQEIVIRAGRLDTGLDGVLVGFCPAQIFSLDGVIDRDSDLLQFRWVANNGSDDPLVVPEVPTDLGEGDERRDPGDPEDPFSFAINLSFPGPFETQMRLAAFAEGSGRTTGKLSLFVTDAPTWTTPVDEQPPDNDFSVVPDGSGSVAGFDWTLVFERGDCTNP